MLQGSDVSTLPQIEQVESFSETFWRALSSGCSAASRFFIRCSTARRAERGPRPGSRARAWESASISWLAIIYHIPFGLSLSKPCFSFPARKVEGQPFDRLRANGFESYFHGIAGLRRADALCPDHGEARRRRRLLPAAAPGGPGQGPAADAGPPGGRIARNPGPHPGKP